MPPSHDTFGIFLAFLRLFQWIFLHRIRSPHPCALRSSHFHSVNSAYKKTAFSVDPSARANIWAHVCSYLHFLGHPRDQVVVDRKFVENVIYNICHHLGAILPARTSATGTWALSFGRVYTHLYATARSTIINYGTNLNHFFRASFSSLSSPWCVRFVHE